MSGVVNVRGGESRGGECRTINNWEERMGNRETGIVSIYLKIAKLVVHNVTS